MADHTIKTAEEHLLHTYNRFPVTFCRGEGVYLYDENGKQYLDFAAGIGVCALGYAHPEYTKALQGQVGQLLHTSNLYYNRQIANAAKRATDGAKLERVFFTNSGTEAIEGAIKAAKKYAYQRDGHTDHEIIAMKGSFHGRSLGALSVTGNLHYQEAFAPLLPGIRFADFNDLDSVTALVNEKTCAILLETIQGEGGIYPATKEFLQEVKAICEAKDILLLLDEIQCGMGRTGEMFAWQQYGIRPDIMASAKGLGAGVPVGAFFLTEKVAEQSLVPGDHGTTYGGNPFVGAAVDAVFTIFEKENVIGNVQKLTKSLEETLDSFIEKYDFVAARRGVGFMQGLVLSVPVGEVVKKALEEGLVVLSAGSDVLRFLPPLIIEEKHIGEMAEKLKRVFDTFASE
ncbi:acetylornithine aminotransferase [Clostridia bacterium]|nr:acetylornithine aminotransferase [Clostridia bacterium]